jgi:hypothetical protein
MSLPDKFIVFLGRTFSGHNHDYSMLKQEFPPELDWFTDIHVRVDLGYLGMQADYRGDQIDVPHKKPRKSKKNPNPQLRDDQKAANKALSQIRIFIEHAIGGMKRYNILVHIFRNRKADFHYRTLSQHGDISINSLNQTAFSFFPAGHWVKIGSSYIPP